MRTQSLIGLSLFALLALGGKCVIFISTHPSHHHHHHVLAPGQVAHTSGLHVHFLIVVSDSRCPEGAACEKGGDAVVALELKTDRAAAQVDLQIVDAARRSAVFQGYQVELTSLEPRPAAGQPIARADYRATINVTRQ
jgi:hypothetical protein